MTPPDYVLSDLHLDHGNIIEYCDRPFDSVEAMNEALVANWNETVDPDDRVLFLGDVTVPWADHTPADWFDRLRGEVVFVAGNHDAPEVLAARDSCRFSRGGRDFFCSHWPENAPADWEGWVLYGHHHDNDLERFPLLDPERRRVNVSVELLEYTPLSVNRLVALVERGERLETLADA
jgi:calcineurin-like phosphoesterase family protein